MEIKQQLEQDTRARMDLALRRLHCIIEPINYKGIIKYKDKFDFIDKNGIEKMWKELGNIIECVEYLRDFTSNTQIENNSQLPEEKRVKGTEARRTTSERLCGIAPTIVEPLVDTTSNLNKEVKK